MLTRPRFENEDFEADPRLVFILMPFKKSFNVVFEHIKHVVEEDLGLRCLRADAVYAPHPVIMDVWELINCARVIVADLTGQNANVAYEVGITHTLQKDAILITQSSKDVPFDLTDLRYIEYDTSEEGLAQLEEGLKTAIGGVMKGEFGTADSGVLRAQDTLKRAQKLWTRSNTAWPTFDSYQEFNLYGDELCKTLGASSLAFVLRVAVHYGDDLVYWAQRNSDNDEAVAVLLDAINGNERRPFFRAGLALEFLSPRLKQRAVSEARERHQGDARVKLMLDHAERGTTLGLWKDPPEEVLPAKYADEMLRQAQVSKRVW